MKLTYTPAPHYRTSQSTSGIMRDLTLCLLAVTLFSIIYYSAAWGASYGLRVVLLMVDSVVTAEAVDALWLKATKKDIKTGLLSSYSWVTAMILTLISTIDTGYFALCVATIIAVVFGKLVFGGFGQNIFNPAAFGEAIIMQSFSASKAADFTTSATPTTVMSSYGWMMSGSKFNEIVSQFGGLGKMLIGAYPSTIGSTCALLILACGVFMIMRRDIDWQLPVFYIGSVFVLTALIGAMHGAGLWYPLFQVLAGGVMFGGIFMVTDPVTSPMTLPGRIVFALGAAALTVIIRTKSNLADGVLYSILLMNMLTPAIDKMFDGSQIRDAKKFRNQVLIAGGCLLAVTLGVGTQVVGKTPAAAASEGSSASSTASAASTVAISSDFSEYEASCTESSNDGKTAVYACSAKGFGLLNGVDGESKNEATVTVDLNAKKVVSVEVTHFGDTEEVGDRATTEKALSQYAGKTASDSADLTTGATFTSKSIVAMVQAALNGGQPLASAAGSSTAAASTSGLSMKADYTDYDATCTQSSADGTTVVYACSAKGFGLLNGVDGESRNEANVTVDTAAGKITSIEVTHFGDTEEVGDRATTDKALAKYEGITADDSVDATTGATYTSKSIAAMAQAALNGGQAPAAGTAATAAATAASASEGGLSLSGDYAKYEAACTESSNDGTTAVYACSAKGFGLLNGVDGESKNEVNVTVDVASKSIKSIELVHFGDTEEVGDRATTDKALAKYEGVTLADSVDATTAATFTSSSIAAMAQAALNAVSGN